VSGNGQCAAQACIENRLSKTNQHTNSHTQQNSRDVIQQEFICAHVKSTMQTQTIEHNELMHIETTI
jgi:hypothetical protein